MGLAYGAAIAAALLFVSYSDIDNPVIEAFLADFLGTVVIFLFSVIFKNSSMYDPYWSVAPPLLAAYFHGLQPHEPHFREVLAFTLILTWSFRLTYNFLRGWTSIQHEDWRYVNIRQKTGIFYWPVSFLGIHLFPTILVFFGCLPFIFIFQAGNTPMGWLDLAGFLVMGTGIALEWIGDRQLWQYRNSKPEPGKTFRGGLWKYSRHPNYLGEMIFWWGICLFGLANSAQFWVNYIGAGAITLLFLFISIPMIEKRMKQRRDDYQDYKRTAGMLLPKWIRRKN